MKGLDYVLFKLIMSKYLVLRLGDTHQSTPTIMKTLNPEWNVSFDLHIVGTHSLLLEAVCWDKDRFGKDYLGEFDVALEDIFANQQLRQEVRLSIPCGILSLLTQVSQLGMLLSPSKRVQNQRALESRARCSYNSPWQIL